MKTVFIAATIALATVSTAQARDSLVQARDIFQGIACRATEQDVHNNMITCPFARAIDNGLKWIDEIKPGDTNQEAQRKIDNATSVMEQPDEETIQAIDWTVTRTGGLSRLTMVITRSRAMIRKI